MQIRVLESTWSLSTSIPRDFSLFEYLNDIKQVTSFAFIEWMLGHSLSIFPFEKTKSLFSPRRTLKGFFSPLGTASSFATGSWSRYLESMQSDTDSSCFSLSLSLCISLVSFSFLIESRVNHDEICHTPGGKNNRCHSGRRTTASNLLFDINGGCDRDKRSTWARLSLPSFFLKLPQKYESNYDGEPSIRRIHSW